MYGQGRTRSDDAFVQSDQGLPFPFTESIGTVEYIEGHRRVCRFVRACLSLMFFFFFFLFFFFVFFFVLFCFLRRSAYDEQ